MWFNLCSDRCRVSRALTPAGTARWFLGLLVACLLAVPTHAQVYDAVADFSLDGNPNGPWSYGTLSSFTGGTFTPNTIAVAGFVVLGVDAWWNGQPEPNSASVYKNTTGDTLSLETIVLPPDLLALDCESLIATVRWEAPEDGLYDILGLFEHIDTYGKSVSLRIIVNGTTTLFAADEYMNYGDQQPFVFFDVPLSAGDVVDFALGAPQWTNDSTGLAATIVQSPRGAGR